VGYAGGTKDNPTYRSLGDHTEVVQIYFNPQKVDYQHLLNVFFASHNPVHRAYSRQYMSLILFHDTKQEKLAQEAIEELQKSRGVIHTELAPFSRFFLAEAYHQKYYLRRVSALISEVESRYDTLEDLVSSVLAARLNGYVGGYGTLNSLKKDLESFNLTENSRSLISNIVSTR